MVTSYIHIHLLSLLILLFVRVFVHWFVCLCVCLCGLFVGPSQFTNLKMFYLSHGRTCSGTHEPKESSGREKEKSRGGKTGMRTLLIFSRN